MLVVLEQSSSLLGVKARLVGLTISEDEEPSLIEVSLYFKMEVADSCAKSVVIICPPSVYTSEVAERFYARCAALFIEKEGFFSSSFILLIHYFLFV